METNDSITPNPDPGVNSPPFPSDEVPESVSLRTWLVQNGPTLAIMLAVVVGVGYSMGLNTLLGGLYVCIALGFVIFIHELGHFAVAKWCDVHVETFSIGFGPPLPGCWFQRGETVYKLAIIPLGGYVKMLGEGAEDDPEGDDNPRSYKNKSVPQRMAIISAGVIMNVLLGCVVFIYVYMTHGERQLIGAADFIDPGSPAWSKGIKSGDMIYRIANVVNPTFNELRVTVPLAPDGELAFWFGDPGGPKIETTIRPRLTEEDQHPVIGLTPPSSLLLLGANRKLGRDWPAFFHSPAARAGFHFGDEIIATTDPDQPSLITDLPPNRRNPESKTRDFFEFRQRLQRLAGQSITVRVLRDDGAGKTKTVDLTIEPAYQVTFGMRMKMGPVVAVRPLKDGSDNPIQFKNQVVNGQQVSGDLIKAVEVPEPDGSLTRWVLDQTISKEVDRKRMSGVASTLGLLVPAGGTSLVWSALAGSVGPLAASGVVEKPLDPVRLGFELKQWALRRSGDKVRLYVARAEGVVPCDLVWDDRYRFTQEVPLSLSAPISIAELGIAYQVETVVEDVVPGSPATRGTLASGQTFELKKGDVINQVHFYQTDKDGKDDEPAPKPMGDQLKQHQWALVATRIQRPETESKKLKLRVEREGQTYEVVMTAEPDPTWPMIDRGMIFQPDTRLKVAESPGQAISMGYTKTANTIVMVYQMIRGLLTGRLAKENVGGPLMIFMTGYSILEFGSFADFLIFLAMISVNLAVVNFLPIPILDGGHFVFLLYEGLRGKPASERIRVATAYLGLALLLLLMCFVVYQDVKRYFF